VLVEKILTGEETLPADWPVSGTVGYEFLNRVNGLFVRGENAGAMDAVYHGFAGPQPRFADLAYSRKRLILRISLVSELTVLAALLDRISETSRRWRDFTYGSLLDALRATAPRARRSWTSSATFSCCGGRPRWTKRRVPASGASS
jgi:(1->4)-alpha-D-glucan 1-alpha-D-glucosylmutase